MGKHIQIGALVAKEHGLSAYNDIASSKGVLYAFLETGRSNDLFSEKQFGEFGEAAILTMVVEANEKNNVLERLVQSLNIDANGEGLVFEETDILKVSDGS
tara:strand:- start:303 stop:605 length:303 start_codon:yes stop_codon:yes gene_type:complete